MKHATRQLLSQSGRKSTLTTHNFHKGYGQNSVTHRSSKIDSVSQNTPLWKLKETHFCQNSISLLQSIVWATKKKWAMERSWHLHKIYPRTSAGRYLPQSWHLWKVTMLHRNSNFKTSVDQNIPQVSHMIPNSWFILNFCRIKAYSDA